jgi:hypothetical protein
MNAKKDQHCFLKAVRMYPNLQALPVFVEFFKERFFEQNLMDSDRHACAMNEPAMCTDSTSYDYLWRFLRSVETPVICRILEAKDANGRSTMEIIVTAPNAETLVPAVLEAFTSRYDGSPSAIIPPVLLAGASVANEIARRRIADWAEKHVMSCRCADFLRTVEECIGPCVDCASVSGLLQKAGGSTVKHIAALLGSELVKCGVTSAVAQVFDEVCARSGCPLRPSFLQKVHQFLDNQVFIVSSGDADHVVPVERVLPVVKVERFGL